LSVKKCKIYAFRIKAVYSSLMLTSFLVSPDAIVVALVVFASGLVTFLGGLLNLRGKLGLAWAAIGKSSRLIRERWSLRALINSFPSVLWSDLEAVDDWRRKEGVSLELVLWELLWRWKECLLADLLTNNLNPDRESGKRNNHNNL
jgi:hypothetical protein